MLSKIRWTEGVVSSEGLLTGIELYFDFFTTQFNYFFSNLKSLLNSEHRFSLLQPNLVPSIVFTRKDATASKSG